MTVIPKPLLLPNRCLIHIRGEFIAVFDDLPSPSVLGNALVQLLQKAEIGHYAQTYFQDIVKADWRWSGEGSQREAEGLLHQGGTVALSAEFIPFFHSGKPTLR